MWGTSFSAAILSGAVLAILLGMYLWKKGDKKEPFWQALFDVIFDFFTLEFPVFFSFRAWAVFLWIIGFGILIMAIVSW